MYKLTTKLPIQQIREPGTQVSDPQTIANECADMRLLCQETLQIITLNTRNKIIDRHLIHLGSIKSSVVSARDVFRAAINDNANSIIMIHNHPSGDPSPSAEDIRITKKIRDAGELMEIKLLDHIIIGQKKCEVDFCSLRESKLVSF